MLRLSTDERKRPKQGKGGSQWTLALIDLIKAHRSVNRKLRVWERPATPQVYGKLTGKDGKSGKVGKWSGNGKGYGDQGHQGPENYENYENYGNYPMEGIPEYYGQGQGDQGQGGQGGQDQYQDWWGGWYPNPWMQANCLKLREITAMYFDTPTHGWVWPIPHGPHGSGTICACWATSLWTTKHAAKVLRTILEGKENPQQETTKELSGFFPG